jgi:FSR family fosmidomycin resistance protein-like MFS transporter
MAGTFHSSSTMSQEKARRAVASPDTIATEGAAPDAGKTVFAVLLAISFCHLLNDMMQSLLPAIYPALAQRLNLSFAQIGLISFTYQITASILQPVLGYFGDKRPTPMALSGGTLFTLVGLSVLSIAHQYWIVLIGACMLGMGSSVFHPEGSRVARMAAGGRFGLAQSLFQIGGNVGQALGPLAAALIVVTYGQSSLMTFAMLALLSCAVLWNVGLWYRAHGLRRLTASAAQKHVAPLPRKEAIFGIATLLTLIFSKYVYLASISSYYTFYLIHRFGVSVQNAQIHLFVFLSGVAIGTLMGGPLGDRIGRKYVIWFSILGALPFTLLLPHVNLFWTGPLTFLIGLILSSAFPAIVVFAQELVPGKVGTISGLFFGFSFGCGGLGAAALGWVADATSIETVYQICAFLPAIGLVAAFLPKLQRARA